MNELPPGEGQVSPEPKEEREDEGGILTRTFFQAEINYSNELIEAGEEPEENTAIISVYRCALNLLRTNPFLDDIIIGTIQDLVNSFASSHPEKQQFQEEQLAMQIATYLHSLPSEKDNKLKK